ncbi:hypothetical protein LC724_34415 [Blautia sp. RD014234]|nr:hypothetical protein [Blautia parvula]
MMRMISAGLCKELLYDRRYPGGYRQSTFEHLKSANLLRNIEAAVTWHELENAYRDVIQLITSTRVKREDISNYVIKKLSII